MEAVREELMEERLRTLINDRLQQYIIIDIKNRKVGAVTGIIVVLSALLLGASLYLLGDETRFLVWLSLYCVIIRLFLLAFDRYEIKAERGGAVERAYNIFDSSRLSSQYLFPIYDGLCEEMTKARKAMYRSVFIMGLALIAFGAQLALIGLFLINRSG